MTVPAILASPGAALPDHPKVAPSRRRMRRDGDVPSLADVARAAKVSTASASRALARPELVSEAVRARVSEAAALLGYVANAAARSLSTRKSGLVGAVLSDPADPVVLQMLEAAELCLSLHGAGVLVRAARAGAPAAACAQALAERGVDGLLFIGAGATPDRDGWKSGRSLPYIGCGQKPGSGVAAPGETIERRGLALACAYLQQLGHRHIGIIGRRGGDGGDLPASLQENAMMIEHKVDALDDMDAVRAAVRRHIENAATAIVASSDVAAAAALRECRALGLTAPRQISVIGWGDSALARCLDPQLTSVRLPASASGQAAADWLLAALAGREFTWPDLPLKLVIRESTGRAPT
ncbi:MAG TPA: LacI family DNA-binding transcriptional regulator [Casimicrobiaceae bacterium]|nr:LacI family DNA-binding transcriptional regulator [Casimicrobiaceae bacterium]